ncbi:hypothetical protein NQ318_019700 [Aromia moschata]|uniref:Uncharacterized protein n=1 Tax=Aromia moschata TaxID=1265417 RepID=A0AAV8Z4I9_9CUCU|nr:hypothetical protein NQ318_019700 [Aromia moschata]
MFNSQIFLCSTIVILGNSYVHGMWPPPYKVNLTSEEIFVISEPLEKSDVQDVYDEEEMIKMEEMKEINLKSQNDKYYRIHQHYQNQEQLTKRKDYDGKKEKPFEEFNPDSEEPLPWKAGFVDQDDEFLPEKGMIYFDEDAKLVKEGQKQKRADSANGAGENYDYANLKAEYNKEVKMAAKSKETLKYSTVKEDESFKDSAKALVNFKQKPRNCTAEEAKGIGLGAVECFWMEANKPKTNSKIFEKILRIFVIWIVVYIVVAIPCWCQYGWCCCCCRCKFCRPKEQIDDIKKFIADNPVGVFHDEEGNKIKYKPTYYEKYAQKRLEEEINRL